MGNFFRKPVTQGYSEFNPKFYQGLWYEIARYPNYFERNCEQATAEYSLKDGYLQVINRCYSQGKEVNVSKGQARITPIPGELLVKFDQRFTPEGSYIVLWTDYNNLAFVTSAIPGYYWVLSRRPQVDKDFIKKKTIELGYDPEKLLFSS